MQYGVFRKHSNRPHHQQVFLSNRYNYWSSGAYLKPMFFRFSKDIEATENKIPETFKFVVKFVLSLLSAIVVISITTPFFLFAFIPLFIVYFLLQVSSFWRTWPLEPEMLTDGFGFSVTLPTLPAKSSVSTRSANRQYSLCLARLWMACPLSVLTEPSRI